MANSDLQAVLNIRAGVTGLSDIELLINTIEDAGGDVEQLRRQYQHLNNTWNTLSTEEQARQFGELRNQVVRTNNALSHSQNSTNQANTGLKDLRNTLMGFAGAYVGVDAVVSGIHELVETSKQLDSLNQKLEYATGSAEEAGETWEYLKNLANELGLEQIDLANGYAQLASATKNLNMSQEDTRLAFEGVANATAGMNLSADEANGVFLALSQIAGKGKVSMEELRGQLGERLTPAMGIASKAMGVTVQELEKMVESGINAKEFLPKFGLALTEAFGEQAQNNITTTTGKLNLLENKTTDLKEKLLDGFAGEGISSGIDLLTNGIDKISNAIDNIDPKTIEIVKETFEQFGEVARTSFTQLMTIISGIEENFQAINVAINGTTAQAEKFSLINSLILGVNVSLGAFNDGLKAIGIAFDLARGVSTQFFASIADNLSKVTFGDLSDKLKAYAVELNKASEESFERAKEKALGFKSSAVKAMEDYANASKQAMQEIEVDSSQATDKVVADLEKMANAGGQSAEDIRMKMADTAQSLGIDFELASDNLSRAMQGSSRDMQTLASNFDALKKQGYDASNLLIQSLTNMQDKVKNKADLQQLTNLWQQFGKEGKLSAQQVESGIDALNQKLSKQPQFLDETTKAFQQLGIISKVQAEKQAQAQMQAFELVKKSGQASSEQLQKALDNISKNIENSGNASLKTWAKSQQSATQTKETVKEVTTEYKNQVQAIQEVEQADNQATQSQQSNSNALLAMLERIMEVHRSRINPIKEALKLSAEETEEIYKKLNFSYFGLGRVYGTFSNFFEDMKKFDEYLQYQVKGFMDIRNEAIKFTKSLGDAELSTKELTQAQDALYKATNASVYSFMDMDNQTLDNLQNAIDKAQQKMENFAKSAKSTADDLEANLARIKGDDTKARELEQTKKLTALEEKLNQAKQRGNQEEIAQLQRALNLQKQINSEENKQAEAKKKQRENRAKQRLKPKHPTAQSTSTTHKSNNRNSTKIDVSAVADAWDERIRQAEQRGAENALKQLRDDAQRRAR